MARFDVVVAGGGIAGATTAVALARRGASVLVCEAGLPSTRRLAGELLHPPGAQALDDLGLLPAMEAAGAVPSYGFAVFESAEALATVLSYSEIPGGRPTGLALEHGVLTRTLLDAAKTTPGVTVWEGSRVLDARLEPNAVANVNRGGQPVRVHTNLVVSAEGRRSKLRERAGISTREEPPFRMLGWKIPGGRLPYPGYGHVFIGGPSPILAYQVSQTEVRIMFEVELDGGLEVPEALLLSLPEPFRTDVRAAIAEQPRSTARVVGHCPSGYTAPNLAVVGDAGGCVHPLTASGMSFCVGDAMRLAECVGDARGSITTALARYDRIRRGPMATRSALGPAMVEALCDPSPSMRLLRHGLFRYWSRSMRGRGVSMGLLSTHEGRLSVMAREYAVVCANALTGLSSGVVSKREAPRALVGLAHRSAGFALNSLNLG